jgi:hypothetical protein
MFVSLRRGCLQAVSCGVSALSALLFQGRNLVAARNCTKYGAILLPLAAPGTTFLQEIASTGTYIVLFKTDHNKLCFRLLTLLVRHAKVSSTCAAVPFGEVRDSQVPACRLSSGGNRSTAKYGHTSQPLAMLGAARSLESDVLGVAPFVKEWRQHSLKALKDFRVAQRALQLIGHNFQSAGVDNRQSRLSRIEPQGWRGGRTGLIRVRVRFHRSLKPLK